MRKILSSRPNFDGRSSRNPHEYPHILYILETRIIGLYFAANSIDLSSFKLFWWAAKNYLISARVTFQPFKVVQGHWFWNQSKARKDFLLVRNSNLGPILTVSEIWQLLCTPGPTPIHPSFGGVPVALDGPCLDQCEQGPYAIRPWNYFRSIPACIKAYLNVTDGRTGDLQSHNRALRSIARQKWHVQLP